jgi:hypothetical protein
MAVVVLDHVDERDVQVDGHRTAEPVGCPADLFDGVVLTGREVDLDQVVEELGLALQQVLVVLIEWRQESFEVTIGQG